ncbi:MAG TPA: FTR1 family protein [Candidatus Binatia bacterium]|nr:FTR1 family protein [Candidatus Binatia bacterium]
MLETLLITWRESLEAALIVGILLTYLARSGQRTGVPYVWGGTAAAVLAALGCAAASNGIIARLDPDLQELVQTGVLLLAVGVLTWMVLWMHRHARAIRGDLQRRADAALARGRLIGLATIAFAAVFREGVETVLFLWGVVVQRAGAAALPLAVAGLAGAALAIATAWLFFRGFGFLDLQTFFRVTGVLLLLVAAGLLASAINKLIGLGYVSPLVPQVWNSGWLVRDDSLLGRLLGALVGYRSRPSLLELLAYCAYFPPVVWLLRRAQAVPAGRAPRHSAA